jgi:hypothetical protein
MGVVVVAATAAAAAVVVAAGAGAGAGAAPSPNGVWGAGGRAPGRPRLGGRRSTFRTSCDTTHRACSEPGALACARGRLWLPPLARRWCCLRWSTLSASNAFVRACFRCSTSAQDEYAKACTNISNPTRPSPRKMSSVGFERATSESTSPACSSAMVLKQLVQHNTLWDACGSKLRIVSSRVRCRARSSIADVVTDVTCAHRWRRCSDSMAFCR